MNDHGEAISRGVAAWLEANKDAVLGAIENGINKASEAAVDGVATGIMIKAGRWFEENRAELVTAVAAAMAAARISQQSEAKITINPTVEKR